MSDNAAVSRDGRQPGVPKVRTRHADRVFRLFDIIRSIRDILRFWISAPALAQIETVRPDAQYVRDVTLVHEACARSGSGAKRLWSLASRVLPARIAYRLFFVPMLIVHIARDVREQRDQHGAAMADRGLPLEDQYRRFLRLCLRYRGLPASACYRFDLQREPNHAYIESISGPEQVLMVMALAGRLRVTPGLERFRIESKFGFKQFCDDAGLPAPPTVALISAEEIVWESAEEGLPQRDLFYKPDLGHWGVGARRIYLVPESGRYDVEIIEGDGPDVAAGPFDAPDLLTRLKRTASEAGGWWILQPRLTNARRLVELVGATTLATLRVITTRDLSGRIETLGIWLRVASLDAAAANLHLGGLMVRIDPETGRIDGAAWRVFHEGGIERHPQTGQPFAGFPVPFVPEIIAMCERGHEAAQSSEDYALPVLGWDVVITDEGPIFLEVNTGPDAGFQRLSPQPFWRMDAFRAAMLTHLEPIASERVRLRDLGHSLFAFAERTPRSAGMATLVAAVYAGEDWPDPH